MNGGEQPRPREALQRGMMLLAFCFVFRCQRDGGRGHEGTVDEGYVEGEKDHVTEIKAFEGKKENQERSEAGVRK